MMVLKPGVCADSWLWKAVYVCEVSEAFFALVFEKGTTKCAFKINKKQKNPKTNKQTKKTQKNKTKKPQKNQNKRKRKGAKLSLQDLTYW